MEQKAVGYVMAPGFEQWGPTKAWQFMSLPQKLDYVLECYRTAIVLSDLSRFLPNGLSLAPTQASLYNAVRSLFNHS